MKIVFIIGTGRCGSTLLNEVLAKHKGVRFVSTFEENHRSMPRKLRALSNKIYRQEHLPFVGKFAKQFRPTEAYGLIRQKVSTIYVQPTRDLVAQDVNPWLSDKFRAFFQENHSRNSHSVLVHKYTGWSRMGFFKSIFPEAKFVHVVRDGRAVANSWLQMPWWTGYQGPEQWLWGPLDEQKRELWELHDRSFVALAGICWNKLTASYDRASLDFSDEEYMQIRYEDFISDPVSTSKSILDFAGLDWTSRFGKQLDSFDITSSRAQAYKRDLTLEQQAILESISGEQLRNYGYEL